MQEDSLQLGLPIPDKVSVKQHYLRKGVSVSDLATVNDFLRFYIVMNRDKINENGEGPIIFVGCCAFCLRTCNPRQVIRAKALK